MLFLLLIGFDFRFDNTFFDKYSGTIFCGLATLFKYAINGFLDFIRLAFCGNSDFVKCSRYGLFDRR